ncbi:MAG: SRPBCC family protein [Candidatus Humimicrobiia bacterium]
MFFGMLEAFFIVFFANYELIINYISKVVTYFMLWVGWKGYEVIIFNYRQLNMIIYNIKLKGGEIMPKVERNVTVNTPVKKVFDYIANPEHQPEWLPGSVEVKNINLTDERVGSTFKYVYKLAGIRLKGEDTTEEFIPNKRLVTREQRRHGVLMDLEF